MWAKKKKKKIDKTKAQKKKDLKGTEITNLLSTEFKVTVIKMLTRLERRLDELERMTSKKRFKKY